MDKIRILYTQTGRAVWMSHLDTMRTLQRAILRADVPIKYSEGFNPHAQLSILMPLSVGTASLCQIADIRLQRDVDLAAVPERLSRALPEGFQVQEAYENGAKPAELKWLRVEGAWEYDSRDAFSAAEDCRELFSAPVVVTRRTKRGEGPFTVTEHIRSLDFSAEEGIVRVTAVVSCAEPVVNPDLLTAAVIQNRPELAPDGGRFTRLALYKADGSPFR